MKRFPVPCPPRGARNMRPTLTKHARARCAEMGVSTDTIIDIVYNADLRYTSIRNGRTNLVAKADAHPEYAVIYDPENDGHAPAIITVVFATEDTYDRSGATYVSREATP